MGNGLVLRQILVYRILLKSQIFLSREIIKASETFPGKSSETNKFAVLLSAALNITSEFFDLKKTYLSLSKGVTEKSEVLISKIKKITG